ncbi:hypothetical protein WJX73_001998 [Symbiochloris irregularis]|uniref:Uncharacterized protein n=1 Tax=Symbiochloris irregularis TaxID=706552 RepID=A0AAW1P1V6_9CHLO
MSTLDIKTSGVLCFKQTEVLQGGRRFYLVQGTLSARQGVALIDTDQNKSVVLRAKRDNEAHVIVITDPSGSIMVTVLYHTASSSSFAFRGRKYKWVYDESTSTVRLKDEQGETVLATYSKTTTYKFGKFAKLTSGHVRS